MHQLWSDGKPLLTVIVPVFNEEATIDALLCQVLASSFEKQIIVVDDGSTDRTSAIVSAWHQRGLVEACHHERNSGKGRAIRTALEGARGRFIIIQDGDLETDPQDYPRLIEPLLQGRADFVIGTRFANSSRLRVASAFRLGVHLLNLAVRLLYGVRVTDEACCYKILSTETLKAMGLECERFEFCSEVLAKASRMGLRIAEVAVRYSPRSAATGKKIRYRDGLRALWCLWKLRHWSTESHAQRREESQRASVAQVRSAS